MLVEASEYSHQQTRTTRRTDKIQVYRYQTCLLHRKGVRCEKKSECGQSNLNVTSKAFLLFSLYIGSFTMLLVRKILNPLIRLQNQLFKVNRTDFRSLLPCRSSHRIDDRWERSFGRFDVLEASRMEVQRTVSTALFFRPSFSGPLFPSHSAFVHPHPSGIISYYPFHLERRNSREWRLIEIRGPHRHARQPLSPQYSPSNKAAVFHAGNPPHSWRDVQHVNACLTAPKSAKRRTGIAVTRRRVNFWLPRTRRGRQRLQLEGTGRFSSMKRSARFRLSRRRPQTLTRIWNDSSYMRSFVPTVIEDNLSSIERPNSKIAMPVKSPHFALIVRKNILSTNAKRFTNSQRTRNGR